MNIGHPWIQFITMKNLAVLDHVALDVQFSSEKLRLDGLNPGWTSLITRTKKKRKIKGAKHDALLNFDMPAACFMKNDFFSAFFAIAQGT